MVMAAFVVLSLLVLGEAGVIYGLLNRLLAQARVAPLEFPQPFRREPEEESPAEQRRKLMTIDIPS